MRFEITQTAVRPCVCLFSKATSFKLCVKRKWKHISWACRCFGRLLFIASPQRAPSSRPVTGSHSDPHRHSNKPLMSYVKLLLYPVFLRLWCSCLCTAKCKENQPLDSYVLCSQQKVHGYFTLKYFSSWATHYTSLEVLVCLGWPVCFHYCEFSVLKCHFGHEWTC